MTSTGSRYFIAFLLFFTVAARVWGIGSPAFFFDENLHVPTASHYMEKGQLWPDFWYHPPLKHILLYCSLKLFGDNPYGWRMRNVLFGSLSVLLLLMLGRLLFEDRRVACLAASFMAVEPMHIFTSRIASEEIPAIFFCLAGTYAAVLHLRGSRYGASLAGLFFGLAIATKWYFQLAVLLLLFYLLFVEIRTGSVRWRNVLYLSASLTLLPAAVYVLTFIPWFCRGYSLPEFMQMQIGAFRTLQTVTMTGFFASSTAASEWFVKPIVMIKFGPGGWHDYQAHLSNFPVWLLAIPSAVFVVFRLRERFDGPLFLVLLIWAAMYLPLLLLKRPILLYSSLPLLPFVYLMASYSIVSLISHGRAPERVYRAVITALFLWGIYLWPLVSRLPVPDVLYEPLRAVAKVAAEN